MEINSNEETLMKSAFEYANGEKMICITMPNGEVVYEKYNINRERIGTVKDNWLMSFGSQEQFHIKARSSTDRKFIPELSTALTKEDLKQETDILKIIKTFKELYNLPNSTKVYNIVNSNYKSYQILGSCARFEGEVFMVNHNDRYNFKVVSKDNFKDTGIWTLNYDAKEIGKIMLEQLEEVKKTILEIYLKEK